MPTQATLSESGYALIAGILTPAECKLIADRIPAATRHSAGHRGLLSSGWCRDLATQLRNHPSIRALVPRDSVAIQCTYFEKSDISNWLVPLHQDLSIPVARQVDDTCLTGWSKKDDTIFVHAPVEVLERMLAVRVHLDVCGLDNGPLRVVPGSHKLGCLQTGSGYAREFAGLDVACPAGQGEVLLMHPLLLHASSKIRAEGKRRVLHFVFGPPSLPYGLRWKTAVHV